MKKLILFLLVAGFPLLAWSQDDTAATQLLEEDKYSIEYPSDWKLDQTGMMGSRFILFLPVVASDAQFQSNINLMAQELPGENIDLSGSVDATVQQLEAMIEDFKLIGQKNITTPNGPCQIIEYTGKFGKLSLQWEQRFWYKNDTLYGLTLSMLPEEVSVYQEVARKAMDTFWIK